MKLYTAKNIAQDYINNHVPEWVVRFDSAKRRFGCCKYRSKTLSFSRTLVQLNDIVAVTKVIIHEVAHAIVGPGQGHNYVWAQKCRELGGDGLRCYRENEVATPKAPYTLTCPKCGQETHRHRLSGSAKTGKIACGRCCKMYANNRYDERFLLIIKKNY